MKPVQTDAFNATYDNTATRCRETYRDGRLMRYERSNAVGVKHRNFSELEAPWGTYPDLPSHFRPSNAQELRAHG